MGRGRPRKDKNDKSVKPKPVKKVKEIPLKNSIWTWRDYLNQTEDIVAVPVSNFPHVPLAKLWNFFCRVGMKVEAPTKLISTNVLKNNDGFWLAEVISIAGYMVKLRFINVEEIHDQQKKSTIECWAHWCQDVWPVGYCKSQELSLIPPYPSLKMYIDQGNSKILQDMFYQNIVGKSTKPHIVPLIIEEDLNSKFKPEETVEVVDNFCVSRMTVATILETIGCRHHVLYWNLVGQPDKKVWLDERSGDMQRSGWSKAVGHAINAPVAYEPSLSYKLTQIVPPITFPDVNIQVGMRLECVDIFNPKNISAALVTGVLRQGYLMIKIDNVLPDENDEEESFCVHITSNSIFKCGFCKSQGIQLIPPANYKGDITLFDWDDYFIQTGCEPNVLPIPQRAEIVHDFIIGSSLEVADLQEPHMISPGTVIEVHGRLVKVHFTGYVDDEFDQWHDVTSCDLYPVGWCDFVGYKMQPPFVPMQHAKK